MRYVWDFLCSFLDMSTREARERLLDAIKETPATVGKVLASIAFVVLGLALCIPLGAFYLGLWGYVSIYIPVYCIRLTLKDSADSLYGMLATVGMLHTIVGILLFLTIRDHIRPWVTKHWHYTRTWLMLKDGGYYLFVTATPDNDRPDRHIFYVDPGVHHDPQGVNVEWLASDEYATVAGTPTFCSSYHVHSFAFGKSLERVELLDMPLYVGLKYVSSRFQEILSGVGV